MTAVRDSASDNAAENESDSKTERKPRTGRLHAISSGLTAWLGRPLASFHLVLAICTLLIVIGLVMVLSASPVVSINQGSSAYAVFGKQVVFV
ncbi:MAG: FtsW/RodA/SpoVE family cell cycle protein, partial [Actinomycetota bacterium]|nr:FtsW/RodA/SpoVE family cell cycle protein [Actinomycetota bacterium]